MSESANDSSQESGTAAAEHPPTLDEVLSQALAKALACHRAGQLAAAEQLYRAILQAQADHPEANHHLGLLEVQRQQPAAALPHLVAALEASPASRQYWLSYLEALLLAGQAETARQVLELGRQHGLEGEAVDALALRLAQEESVKLTPQQSEPRQPKASKRAATKVPPALSGKPSSEEERALVALFTAGRYSEGESVARALTERFPRHGFAWKVLATLLKAQGRDDEALPAMRHASRLLPRDEQVQSNLGLILVDRGELAAAETCQRKALRIRPDFAEAHYNLGNVLCSQGRPKEAEASYRRAAALKPDFASAHFNLGNVLMNQGRLAEAEVAFRRTLELAPDLAEAHNNLGDTLRGLDRPGEAESALRRALECRPDFAEALYNLGTTLGDLGRGSEAEIAWRNALDFKAHFPEALLALGSALAEQGRFAEAESHLRRALACRPDFAEALVALSATLRARGGRDSEAESTLRRALLTTPALAEGHYNLGNILRDQERHSEAEASYRRALELRPELASAYLNLAVTLAELARYAEAEQAYRHALALDPDYPLAHSNLLFCLTHNEKVDARTLFAEHRRFAEQFETPLLSHWAPHDNSTDPDRCLRVGLVSADFRNHAVASFIEPVLAELARDPQLSIHAYSTYATEDEVTQRLRKLVAHWHAVAGTSDAALAETIRADGIDVLIDLSGHTGHHRLLTFAHKPAPLQASWMGYPGTTGLHAMDYYLADRFFLPVGKFDEQFTEKIARIPVGAPFQPFADAPPVNALPALAQGQLTFASFNRPTKISASVIALWSELLRALPGSRMLLGSMRPDPACQQLIDEFARHGISRDRLSLHLRCDVQTYLQLHQQVDICLDTFPYTGGTTTLNALWMGVPTLTLVGETVPGRSGAAILGHVALEEFVTHTPAEFVARGVSWSNELTRLATLRTELRARLQQSGMGQPELVANGLSRALRIMWQRWCKQLPAAAFEVRAQDLPDRAATAEP